MDERHENLAHDRKIAVSADVMECDYPKDVLLVDEDGYLHSKRCLTAKEHAEFADEVFGKR